MRILIHAGNFFPEKTGIGKYTGEMAAWFAARGHEVQVITGFPYYPEWKLASGYRQGYRREIWRDVSIFRVPHYIPKDGHVTSLRRVLVDFSIFAASALPWLGVLFGRKRPDVIIAVCPPLFSGIWPMIVKGLRQVPWIYHIQDFQVDAALGLGMLNGGVLGKLLLRIEKGLLRSATRVSSITPAMCRRAVSKGAAESCVIELANWSDVRGIKPSPRDSAFRRDLGIGPEQTLVMYAGAMGRKQGLSLVLDAAAQLIEDSRFQFVMVGSGSDADELGHQARQRGLMNVHFLPLQPLDRLNEMLASADVHLVIQRAHAADLVMPSKLTNILAAGRPAVATAEPGTALFEAVHDAQTGLVIPPEDRDSLIAALKKLADDPVLHQSLAANARLYAEAHLDQDAILGRFERELFQLKRGVAAAIPTTASAVGLQGNNKGSAGP
ncbi:WcaI family glycosyltransferase [Solimonas flava]|uniref:WcaI family glycosyltransferase n=1 Tax=Solimonas flava TaxID=415849 RepID=UPI0009FD1D54|nr:WcaI family glycosyltransferase [Solimonas flava]